MNENMRKILSRISDREAKIEELKYELSLIKKDFAEEVRKMANDSEKNLLFGLVLTPKNLSSKIALSYVGNIVKAKISKDAELKGIHYFGGFYFLTLETPIGEADLRVPDYDKVCEFDLAYYILTNGYQIYSKDEKVCITAESYDELADKFKEKLNQKKEEHHGK